jgi:methylmalonyl-CoA mutase
VSFPPATDDHASYADPTYESWRRRVEATLGGGDFLRALGTRTLEGLTVEPLYAAGNSFSKDLPGRGTLSGGWRSVQLLLGPSAGQVSQALAATSGRALDGVWLRFDLAFRQGLDLRAAAEKRCCDEVGWDGAAIHRVEDLETAFEGVDLASQRVYLEPGAGALAASAALLAVARRRGVAEEGLGGCLGADALGTLASEGRLPWSLDEAARQLRVLAAWTSSRGSGLRAVLVSSRPYHDAGASAVEELAYALATATEYLRWMVHEDSLDVGRAARQILFQLSTGSDLFLEIAKLRAARRLWSRVVEAAGGGAEAQRMELHVQTSWRELALLDPQVNLVRGTAAGFVAAAAGADSLTVFPYDAAAGAPSARAERLALNTQLILREESYLDRVADAAGGSWYVEQLTDDLSRAAWQLFQEVEAAGGMAECLLGGRVEERLEAAVANRQKAVATRRKPLVGASEFATPEAPLPAPAPWSGARELVTELRRGAPVASAPPQAEEPGPWLAWAVASLEAGASLAAVTAALAAGRSTAKGDEAVACVMPLPACRSAQPYEDLRRRAEALGHPQALLVTLGPARDHRARLGFAANFLAAGGFETQESGAVESPVEAIRAFEASSAQLVVLCGSDQGYQEHALATARALAGAGAGPILLAGKPGDDEQALREAGVDLFIHLGSNVLGILEQLLDAEEDRA